MQNRNARRDRFANQHPATGRIGSAKTVGRPRGISRHPADGGSKIFVRRRIVRGRPMMEQMMAIDHITDIEMAVLLKVRVESEAEHSVVAPGTDFVADVEQRNPGIGAVLQNPNPAGPFPDVGSIYPLRGGIESDADRFSPEASDFLLGKSRE